MSSAMHRDEHRRVLWTATLAGERALVRPLTPSDARPAFRLLHGREEILRWLVWEGPRSPSEMAALFGRWAHHWSEGSDYHLALCDARVGELCGVIGLRFRGHRERCDLGYWVGVASQGRGLATDAIRLASRLAFDHLRADGISAQVFVGNAASRVVLEKNGFVLRRTLEQAVWKRGAAVDEWYFDLARADWERVRGAWMPTREEVEVGEQDELEDGDR